MTADLRYRKTYCVFSMTRKNLSVWITGNITYLRKPSRVKLWLQDANKLSFGSCTLMRLDYKGAAHETTWQRGKTRVILLKCKPSFTDDAAGSIYEGIEDESLFTYSNRWR